MLRILLVDDEPTLRLSLGDALADAGHQVTLAADGAEAVERIKDATFDLVLTDIRMPRMGGLALFREVRQLSPSTDVMPMTAYGEVRDAVAALKEGARDYHQAPRRDELLVRVARVAERHSLRSSFHRGALRPSPGRPWPRSSSGARRPWSASTISSRPSRRRRPPS
ncbi:MAG: response regulator [bacterium]